MKTVRQLISSVASIGKVMLLSGRPSAKGEPKAEPLIIMGNGPSLRDTIARHGEMLKRQHTLAVNFAANAPEFRELQPRLYVLADPHFFKTDGDGTSADPNVTRLWKNLAAADWGMTLFVPCKARIPAAAAGNRNITVKRYNLTPAEGLPQVSHRLFSSGLAMPRPRNVLIASIMVALREGYRRIDLVGADHTWSRDLWVDDRNRVISVQKHFYEDNAKEFERVAQEYAGYHLHDILNSLTIAFRSYHQIAGYAASIGADIRNCTPGSFIDAFPRHEL